MNELDDSGCEMGVISFVLSLKTPKLSARRKRLEGVICEI